MQNRAVVAVILCFLVFLVFTLVGEYTKPKPGVKPTPPPAAEAPAPVVPTAPPAAPKPASPAPAAAPARSPRQVVVDTDLYRAVFTEQGGALKSFRLKHYKQNLPFETIWKANFWLTSLELERYQDPARVKTADKDLVTVAPNQELPLSFSLESRTHVLPGTLFLEAGAQSLTVGAGDSGELVFKGVTPDGLEVIRTYRFKGGTYAFDLTTKVINRTSQTVEGELKLALTGQARGNGQEAQGLIVSANNSLEELKADKLKDPKTFATKVEWAGLDELYFLAVAVPQTSPRLQVTLAAPQPQHLRATLSLPGALPPGQDTQVNYALYFGPKESSYLAAAGLGLEKVINFGWFDWLARPCLWFLKWLNGFVGNYGWSLVILTVLLRLIFWWPNHKSFKSMKVMQKIQPRVAEIREKYKDDREAMNRELMNLYRTFKVNPLGGCLPMLLQLPVFIALYNILSTAIELRHAPFINTIPFTNLVWLADLSAKDPLLITPLVMGASMFVQQKMSPSMGDPTQAKMMMFLPLIFTFLFLNFASGLVIYWLVNNILAIIQQHYTNKYLH
jgi:YidC/Oxa1 family membrane protein insertase